MLECTTGYVRTYGLTGPALCWIFHHLISGNTLAGEGAVCVYAELTASAIDTALIDIYRIN